MFQSYFNNSSIRQALPQCLAHQVDLLLSHDPRKGQCQAALAQVFRDRVIPFVIAELLHHVGLQVDGQEVRSHRMPAAESLAASLSRSTPGLTRMT